MREAEKTNRIRRKDFFAKYCQGKGIDIGCGDMVFVPNAEPFDVKDGDANVISKYRKPATYDFVHSSHCLEHMHDPGSALREWWSLVKPGGYLILVVPEENLYEQGVWPSIFNSDHKWTFRVGGEKSWSKKSCNLSELVEQLENAEVIEISLQDTNYDYAFLLQDHDRWVKNKTIIEQVPNNFSLQK